MPNINTEQSEWRAYTEQHPARIYLYSGDSLQMKPNGAVKGILFAIQEDRPEAPILRISKIEHRLVLESETEDEIVFRLEPK